jgi:hypothetical protein
MDVLSICPFRAASLVWQPNAGGHVLTVVCKATFHLLPIESQLAEQQEQPNDGDSHWDDDRERSLYAPSDVVPFKPRADVLVVGHAFAPRKEPVRSLTARVVVGEVNKAIEIFADRSFSQDGRLRDTSRFIKMPLRYERAAGGPGTSNPAGMSLTSVDRYGNVAVPNLQPVGFKIVDRKGVIEPIGFGPIAPTWPSRAAKLGRHAAALSSASFYQSPLPEDFDPAFFNAAPVDQQLDVIRDNERILLENLSSEHPRLVTNLPGVHPRVFVERRGAGPEDLTMACDTLWIDTDRSLCTVTFRGRVPLEHPNQPGRVIIAMERAGQRVAWSDVERQVGRFAGAPVEGRPEEAKPISGRAPSVTSSPAPTAAATAVAAASAPPTSAAPAASAPPTSAAPAASAPPPSAAPAASAPPSAAPAASAPPTSAPQEAPAPASTSSPAPAAPLSGRAAPRDIVQLLWFDPAGVAKVRGAARFAAVLAELKSKGEKGGLDGEPPPKEAPAPADRRDIFGVLTRAATSDAGGVEEAMREAIADDGSLVPPMIVMAGRLQLPFDELETTKATVTAATPVAGSDKKLRDTIDAVNEILKTPGLESASGIAEGLTARVKEAFAQANRALPWTYLDTNVERMLLANRHYQRRDVFGQVFVRALLLHPLAATSIPTYLPEALARELPLFQSLKVRVIAEVHPAVDQFESYPTALRVLALGRVVALPGVLALAGEGRR